MPATDTNTAATDLHAVALSIVLVIPLQPLLRCQAVERLVDILAALDVQEDVHVVVALCALVVHVEALDELQDAALEQLVDDALHLCALQHGSMVAAVVHWDLNHCCCNITMAHCQLLMATTACNVLLM